LIYILAYSIKWIINWRFLPHQGRGLQRSWRDRILCWLNLFFSLSVSREMTQSMFLFGTVLTASQQGLFTETLDSCCKMNFLHRARISLFCVAVHVGNFPITGGWRKTMADTISTSRISPLPRIIIMLRYQVVLGNLMF
jgi:hypothetical protein